MTKYTTNYNLPYPQGANRVAVHTDLEHLAVKSDVELERVRQNAIRSAQILAEQEAPPKIPVNLASMSDTISGNLSPSGNIHPHNENRVTPFIPVRGGTEYSSMSDNLHMIVWFDSEQNNIPGTDTDYVPSRDHKQWVAPNNAAYVRIGISLRRSDYENATIIFNRGVALVDLDDPTDYPPTGYWDDRELPPLQRIDQEVLEPVVTDIVRGMLPQWEPYPPTLQFETVSTGWSRPLWLSSDGTMLYCERGRILEQSEDELDTVTTVHRFPHIVGAVRDLSDGELLVATVRDKSAGIKAKLWKSSGYSRTAPTEATWDEVLEVGAEDAGINNEWGLSVYQNMVTASEYGLWDVEGSRRVWLSEDYGSTWDLVFDQMTTPESVPGAPEWTTNAHLHGAAWDPYWSRLWVICGDSPSTATYYSDDRGQSWTYVEGTGGPPPAMQFTGIMPLPDAVVFGSDRSPNGLWIYRRGSKADMPVISPWHLVNNASTISHIFGLAYKRDWHPTTPTYFDAHTAVDSVPSLITGFIDGGKAHTLWESEEPDSGLPYSGQLRGVLGETVQGNIIAVLGSDPTVTGYRMMKAPAPTWTRA